MRNELYSICWNLTSKCNENCKFCYRKLCLDNTIDENMRIFDNLSNIQIGKITLCGGEPLLYDSLFELADYIRNKNSDIQLSLTTNGKIMNKKLLYQIINTFDWITFSIDHSDSIVNEAIGRGYNHLSKIEELLELCENLIKIKINTVVSKVNINDLENIYSIISKYFISRWKLMRFYPLRRGKENEEQFYLDDDLSLRIQKFVDILSLESKIQIHYNDFFEFKTSYFNIYPDGSIENSSNEDIGNLKEDSIIDILKIKKKDLVYHNLRNSYNQ